MRKGQGLSLNTIVIGAIVLIVLVVVVAIFTGYIGKFVPGLRAASERMCEGSGDEYTARPSEQGCDEGEVQVFGNFNDVEPDQICCKLELEEADEESLQDCYDKCSDDECLQLCNDEFR